MIPCRKGDLRRGESGRGGDRGAPRALAMALTMYQRCKRLQTTGGRRCTGRAMSRRVSRVKTGGGAAERFVGHRDTVFEQQLLCVPGAQGEPIGEPDPVGEDVAGKAVVLGAYGVGRRGHAWVP